MKVERKRFSLYSSIIWISDLIILIALYSVHLSDDVSRKYIIKLNRKSFYLYKNEAAYYLFRFFYLDKSNIILININITIYVI